LQPAQWRGRLQRYRARAWYALPFAWGVIAALVALLLYHAFTPPPRQLTAADVNTSIAQAFASATVPPPFSERVYQAIRPSFVLIQVQVPGQSGGIDRGLGSGVVVSDQADILTALHVVADATAIQVTFADGSQSSAVVTGKEPESDIAAIRPTRPPALIVPAVLGNPDAMQVGDDAFVVGNPLGLYSSMSAGVISGFDRTFTPEGSQQPLKGLIQFDAAVNPGNSGGPLLNRSGQVVGIITGLVNPTEQSVFIGIGLAVPIDVAGGAAGLPPY
jgi:S1-C subfamily serine protease